MATEQTPVAARDMDKMVRQLSLVAYLMSRRGRRVGAETIRLNVEGYGDEDKNREAFTRRFYADREELARLGIEIMHERDEYGDGEVYWLPPENYFLPAVSFSRGELAALHTCLCLLDGQFAYSRVLRLALQSLALGTGNPLDEPATECFSVSLASAGDDAAVAARQAIIEKAIDRRKTVFFDYWAMGREKPERHTVDPYAMIFTRGDWYLVGHSHQRGATRIFKLRRIQERIRFLSPKSDHNFEIPQDFHPQDYTSLEPWQLGPLRGTARIEFSPRKGWWAQANLARSGEVELRQDGSALLKTGYRDGGPLCSMVLGLHRDARILEPDELKEQMVSCLEKIGDAHAGAPPKFAPAKAGGGRGAKKTSAGRQKLDTPQVPPERFAQLATTISYLQDRLEGQESVTLPVDEVCRDLGFEGRKTLEQAMDLLRLVNIGFGGYLVEGYVRGDEVFAKDCLEGDLLRQPAHLSPREARAMLLALDLVGSQVLGGHYRSLKTAREKILKAAGGLDEGKAIAVGETEKEDHFICRVLNKGLTEHRLVEIEYLSQEAAAPEARRVEPYLLYRVKGRWYLAAWCHKRNEMRTFLLEMMKSATLLDERFEPRDPEAIELDRYTSDPRFPSGREAPNLAEVWFTPELSRWVREKHGNVTELEDGSLVERIPYFNESWVVSEALMYCGGAVLVSPPGLREQVAATAARLAAEYRRSG